MDRTMEQLFSEMAAQLKKDARKEVLKDLLKQINAELEKVEKPLPQPQSQRETQSFEEDEDEEEIALTELTDSLHQEVLMFLHKEGEVTARQVQEQFNITNSRAQIILKSLCNMHLADRELVPTARVPFFLYKPLTQEARKAA